MVIRTPHCDPGCGTRPLQPIGSVHRTGLRTVAAVVLAAALWLLIGAAPAAAQTGTLYFLTLKRGTTDATGSGENLFQVLEPTRGKLTGERAVETSGAELDIYGLSGARGRMGLGVEITRYQKDFNLSGGEIVRLRTLGVLFTLTSFYRIGIFNPFIGAGIGNYYVNYNQVQGAISVRDSPDTVYTGRIGMRVMLGRLGVVWETGSTKAEQSIPTDAGTGVLELGGAFTNLGLTVMF